MEENSGGAAHPINIVLEDSIEFRDSVKGVVKAPALRSPEKQRMEFFSGVERCVSTGGWVDKQRLIDRDHDLPGFPQHSGIYHERVKDEATGEIIHKITEPLSKHQGHGSDKPEGRRLNTELVPAPVPPVLSNANPNRRAWTGPSSPTAHQPRS